MGLYVTRAIIKAHGGKIRLKRIAPDNGSCFIITLPLAKVNP
jgi:K+-sensing histidine kinase KdpD